MNIALKIHSSGATSPHYSEIGSVTGEERFPRTDHKEGYCNTASAGQRWACKSESPESHPGRRVGGPAGGFGNACWFNSRALQ